MSTEAEEQVLNEELIRNRPKLLGVARREFDRTETSAMKAFSQFQRAQDIVDLLEARRKGIFDYAVCVKSTGTGYAWPQKDTVLAALEKAIKGELAEEDMADLGLTAEDYAAVTMGKATKPSQKKGQPAAEAETPTVTTAKASPQPEAKKNTTTTREAKPSQPKDQPVTNNALDSIKDIVDSAVGKANGRTLIALRGLMGMIETVYSRQTILADRLAMVITYLDENAEVGDDMPKFKAEMVTDLSDALTGLPEIEELEEEEEAAAGAPDEEEEEEDDEDEEEEEADDEEEEEEEAKAPATVRTRAAPSPASSTARTATTTSATRTTPADKKGKRQYTEDELRDLPLEKLVEVAEAWGVPNAKNLSYRAVIVRKIRKEGGVADQAAA